MMTLRKRLMAAWVEALRSDRFAQTHGHLGSDPPKHKPERCCLGVACDVYREVVNSDYRKVVNPDDGSYGHEVAYGRNQTMVLPGTVRKAFGIENASGDLVLPVRQGSGWLTSNLAELNDDGLTFGQIADLIEAGFVVGGRG